MLLVANFRRVRVAELRVFFDDLHSRTHFSLMRFLVFKYVNHQHLINARHHNRERNQRGDYGVTRRHAYAIRIDRKCYWSASFKWELWVACQRCDKSQEGRQSTRIVAFAARHSGFAIDSCHCMVWLAWIFKFYDNRRGI